MDYVLGIFRLYADFAPLILRVVLGLAFMAHGYPKLFTSFAGTTAFFESIGLRPAKFWVLWIGILEFVGGIFLILGLFVQPLAILFMIDMFFAILLVGRKKGFVGGWEFEATLFLIAFSLLIMGAGIFAIDYPF